MSSENKYERFVVLAAIDESEGAEKVVQAAAAQAAARPGAEFHLVHAQAQLPVKWIVDEEVVGRIRKEQKEESWKMIDRHLASVQAAYPELKVSAHLGTGDSARVVLNLASKLQANLVVVGTHDYHGAARFILGSIAELIVRKAQCPVLVVRPTTYQSDFFPDVEPPCPECVAVQRESKGESLWCARHAAHHPRAHLHYEYPESFAMGSQLFRY